MTAAVQLDTAIAVFISYAHEDDESRRHLEKQLSLLRRQDALSTWHDQQSGAGREWARDVYTATDCTWQRAQAILNSSRANP